MAGSSAITKATVSPSDLFEFLVTFMPAKRAIVTHSEPGLGKSQIHKAAARRLCGADCVIADVRAGQFDGSIIRGFPDMPPLIPQPASGEAWTRKKGQKKAGVIDDLAEAPSELTVVPQPASRLPQRVAHFAPLACWPQRGPGVIFLDELDKADQEVQNALLELLLDRRLGEYVVPDDVYIVAAANRMIDRAGSNRLNNALKSRAIHLHLVPSLEDWLAWAATHDIHPLVAGYVELKGAGVLHQFDPTDTEADSFPCPRTWETLSDGLKLNHSEKLLYHLIAGSIGANPTAADFAAFAKWYYRLPSKAEVLAHPDTFKIPDEGALRWALAVALVDWSKGADTETVKACITAALRLSAELVCFGMVHIIAKNPSCFKLPQVMKWAAANQSLLNRRRVKTGA